MKTRKPNDLTAITKARDLCSYVLTVTDSSHKRFRFTFTVRLQTHTPATKKRSPRRVCA